MSAVGRLDEGDSRWYVDPTDPELRYESVTTILAAATSKPWLTAWSAKLAAQFVVGHLDLIAQTVTEVGKDGAIDLIKGAAKRSRDLKADIGTHQHNVLEALLLDLPIPPVPEHLIDVEVDGEHVDHDAISDGLINFLTDFEVDPILSEATVCSVMHGYAGTLDMVADIKGIGVALIDCKSGKVLDPSMNAQLAAYRRADEVWVNSLGNKIPMPKTDVCAVLHLRREYERGYKLKQEPADDAAFAWFLSHREVLRGRESQPKMHGRPLYPPLPDGSQPPPLIEDIDQAGFNRCRKPLIEGGVKSLTDLAARTRADLAAMKGIGPKALDAIAELLTQHHMTFAPEIGKVA